MLSLPDARVQLQTIQARALRMLDRGLEEYGLSHREAPASSDRAVDPSLAADRLGSWLLLGDAGFRQVDYPREKSEG